jgi:outer membrane murein-binding lipoprotein Lpp
MSEQANHKCDCGSAKKIKSLESQVSILKAMVDGLCKEIATLRKAVRK